VGRTLSIAGGIAAAAIPFFVAVDAAPEIVVPAYFIAHGGVMYDTIFYPHTPLLLLTLAAAGKLFGFSAILFRLLVAIAAGSAGFLIVRASANRWAALLIAVPVYLYWLVALGAMMLWFDPLMAPLVLVAALLLDRFERDGRGLLTAALILGICVITKQTAAWLVIGACAWLLLASSRRSARALVTFVAVASAPFAIFVVVWAAVFRTTSHLYWTIVLPLFLGHEREIRVVAGRLPVMIVFFLIVPIWVVLTRKYRSPLPWIALAAFGMAWPRTGTLLISAATAIVALMTAESTVEAWHALRRIRTLALPNIPPLAAATLTACLLLVIALTAPSQRWRVRGPVVYWDDPVTTFLAAQVRRHIRPGGAFLNFVTPDTLYAITETTTPSGLYTPAPFWFYLNKRGIDERLCRNLVERHGTPILFMPLSPIYSDPHSGQTCIYRVAAAAPVVESIGHDITWRLTP
jgi:hypothetical protein